MNTILFLVLATLNLTLSEGKHVFSLLDSNANTRSYGVINIRCVSADRKTDGLLAIPLQDVKYDYNASFSLATNVEIPYSAIPTGNGYTETTIVVDDDGGDTDVIVYALTYGDRQGSFMVLPENAIDKEYFVMSYWNSGFPAIAISAIEQGTDVFVYFKHNFSYDGNIYNQGNPFQVTLNQGSFHIQPPFDPTGTYIHATGKIQVISGSVCTGVTSSSPCDHIAESLPPVTSWGRNYAVAPFQGRSSGYVVRIMAAEVNTEVTLTLLGHSETISLSEGTFKDRDISVPDVMTISANKHILVAQFTRSASNSPAIGNPAMVIIPAIEHAIARILPFTSMESTTSHVTVWMSTTDISGLRIDDDTSYSWSYVGAAFGGVIAQTEVSTGSHYVSHMLRSVRLCGLAYGHGGYISYAHPIYYHPFTAASEHSDDLPPVIDDCPVSVSSDCPPDNNFTSVTWDPPGVTSSSALLPDYSNYHSGDIFFIGTTRVIYQFSDVWGNIAECSFDVTVYDVTPPVIYDCPSNFNLSACDSSPTMGWPEPYVIDNSNAQILTKQSRVVDDSGTNQFQYDFRDASGNEANCIFTIAVTYQDGCVSPSSLHHSTLLNVTIVLGLTTFLMLMIACCLLILRLFNKFVTVSSKRQTEKAVNDYRLRELQQTDPAN